MDGFAALRKKLNVEAIDFKKEVDEAELTLQQLRVLKFMEQLHKAMALGEEKNNLDVAVKSIEVNVTYDEKTGIGQGESNLVFILMNHNVR